MAACSVAAIRVETLAQLRHAATNINTKQAVEDAWTEADQNLVDNLSRSSDKPFPRHFLNDNTLPVYWLGHHNEASFGATPYLLQTTLHNGESVSIMIDTPRYSKSSVAAVESITGAKGPDFLVLTHVDDTVDHGKWKEHYKNHLRRIFHSGDLGPHNWLGDKTLEEVEILLHGSVRESSSNLTAYRLDGTQLVGDWLSGSSRDDDVVILHTPGHSPGSITLWDRVNKILFTGDTYAWTTREGGHMSGFPRYGNNLTQQSDTLNALIAIPDWRIIAPGHGHPRDYRNETDDVINEEAVIAREELGRRLR
jgi:glyoxylase-like metal-dependent hydrolase (beta-lactamase superfamily II)